MVNILTYNLPVLLGKMAIASPSEGRGIVIIGETIKFETDERLFWGYDRDGRLSAYRYKLTGRHFEEEHGATHRQCYQKAQRTFSDRALVFKAGCIMGEKIASELVQDR